ncbi:S8 family serine peptidase [Saccharicrinis sp. FJH54]|uniref:S8 family serine peptidase n=1 Tax=Saccharicrinis sp. FJH54 TaxID=3344665 RepID=UPI0035D4EA37
MFKNLLLILILFGLTQNFMGQKKKYLVWLSDKDNTEFSLDHPEKFLTQRAIQRRLNQGIKIDSLDIPVQHYYLDTIRMHDVDIRCTSRWLNTVTIMTDDSLLVEEIRNLRFVDSVNLTWIEPQLKSAKMKFETLNAAVPDYGGSLDQIAIHNGQEMHAMGFTGKGKRIAVLDAGFYHVDSLPAFDSLWMKNQILLTRDFVNPGGDIFDTHTHGMAVLSIMGGNVPGYLVGSAPDADYMLIHTEDAASEYPVEMDYWIAGAEFADSMGADIINSSLGYSVFDDPSMSYTQADLNGRKIRVTQGANIAASKGMLVVNSAGNEGNKSWQTIIGPADSKKVLAVGSVNKDSTYTYFSSRGPTADGRIKPDVASNGYHTVIQLPNGNIGTGNGTSFSSPVMAGMSACLWQAFPRKTAMEIRELILSYSNRYKNPNDSIGYGIPDIYQAWLEESKKNTERSTVIKVYPNPASTAFIVETPPGETLSVLTLYSMEGKIVEVRHLNNEFIQKVYLPDGIAPGMYIMNIVTNKRNLSQKISVL